MNKSSISNRLLSVFSNVNEHDEPANKIPITNMHRIVEPLHPASHKIWKSPLSLRIGFSVFLTILIVQIGLLYFSLKDQRKNMLSDIRENGRSAISAALNESLNLSETILTQSTVTQLLSSTLVKGFSIYTTDMESLNHHGEKVTTLTSDLQNNLHGYQSNDGRFYDVIYYPTELGKPYIVTARLNSERIDTNIHSYISQSIIGMILLSLVVTAVLMATLNRWLLEPILFMRHNLLLAQQNPDNPKIPDSPYSKNNEIGGAIAIAQNLIRQNAENLQQIRTAAEDKIHRLAYFDQLTGLPNRTLFAQKLTEMAFSGDEKEEKRFAVITLDLDHFKDINDSMGHSIGDAILRGVGKRLKASLPENAVVARAGEDEFAVTMPLSTSLNSARDLGEKVADIIRSEPFKVFNENFQIRSSIGVATHPTDGVDPNDVLKNADIALNRAKEEGRDRIREYSEDFDHAVQQRFQLLRDLRDALEKDELSVFYQPQFDLSNGEIIGAEALIRWWKKDNSKEGGAYIPPIDFIPIAEQSGLIVPIGRWVMQEACQTAKKWHNEGKNIRIAVNVSAAQFFQNDLVSDTEQVLKETGVDPKLLELEVTESVFMDDISIAVSTLQKLHKLGVILAVDDFGTGYSSLSYLRQFNIDRLKIDQSFIKNALNNNDDAAIARTIIKLGHSLNLKVIAEGVETKDHENFLKDEGCDEVQGFRYAKPVPKEEFQAFIDQYNGNLDSFDS